MTQRIDLLPHRCREKLRKRSVVRLWVGLYVGSALLLASSTIAFRLSCRPSATEIQLLDAQAALSARHQEEAKRVRVKLEALRRVIARHERIAWPVKMSDVVAVVGSVAPQGVSLTALGITPRQNAQRTRTGNDSTTKRNDSKPGDVLLVEIRGLASSDAHIASFVAGLEAHPLFARVALDYARREQRADSSTREFGITCVVDADRRYIFESPATATVSAQEAQP
ncbi:MAG: hypothetical protein D6824_02055 [Planctomycetota bacterium]|nr:MAG: hypothetical protein D6824_02055 [Planctomycetota bacterium]